MALFQCIPKKNALEEEVTEIENEKALLAELQALVLGRHTLAKFHAIAKSKNIELPGECSMNP